MPTYKYDIATATGDEGYATQYKEIERQHTDNLYDSLQCILSDDHNEQQTKDSIRDKIVAPAFALAWEVCPSRYVPVSNWWLISDENRFNRRQVFGSSGAPSGLTVSQGS